MKNIFKNLFSIKTTDNIDDKNKQTIVEQINDNQQENNSTSKLIFVFCLQNGCLQIEYDVVQFKRKDDTIKCIAKITEKSKNRLKQSDISIDFIKDVIIFPFNQLNKFNLVYLKDNIITHKNDYSSRMMPIGCFFVVMDQTIFDFQLMDLWLEQQIDYITTSYKKCFFNK